MPPKVQKENPMQHFTCCKSSTLLLLCVAMCLLSTQPADAGPPLLCPGTVLTKAELEALEPIRNEDVPAAVAVAHLRTQLAASESGRFHFEAIRYFYHMRHDAMDALEKALAENATDSSAENRATLRKYDRALTRVILHYGRREVLKDVDQMAQAADKLDDSALRLSVAEAIDLVGAAGTGSQYLLSRLSLTYFKQAITASSAPNTEEAKMHRRLISVHLPFMRGMHSRDWDWQELDKALRQAEAETKRRS